MYITKKQFFENCLLSSIAHAMMTNIYPELSYEQSWDGYNYSIQNDSGLRGTVTFLKNSCIGAIRNDKGNIIYGEDAILCFIKQFPNELINVAQSDTLQFLLDYHDGKSVPAITSLFWCDEKGVHLPNINRSNFENDFSLFHTCCLSRSKAIETWKKYYDMNSSAVRLLDYLLTRRIENFEEEIVLSRFQKSLLPGNYLHEKCIESFLELRICFE